MSDSEKSRKQEELEKDVVNSEAAMRRAAKRARELAKQKGSYIVIYRDGKIVKEVVDKDVA